MVTCRTQGRGRNRRVRYGTDRNACQLGQLTAPSLNHTIHINLSRCIMEQDYGFGAI